MIINEASFYGISTHSIKYYSYITYSEIIFSYIENGRNDLF